MSEMHDDLDDFFSDECKMFADIICEGLTADDIEHLEALAGTYE